MRKNILILAGVSVCLICGGQQTEHNKNTDKKEWTLVWQDEFDGNEVNDSKWNILTRETSKHTELQYYIPDEVYLENGNLRIRSSKRDYGNKHYTSGRLDTKDKMTITYGRIEIRGKLPVGQGIWPAYWLYPQNRDWMMEYIMKKAVDEGKERSIPEFRPWYTEIDMMEFLGHEPNVFYATYHYYSFEGEKKTSAGKYVADFSFAEEFHIFVLEWEADAVKWYIDGKLVHTATEGIPHAPHFLILNTAIGGSWPGNPDETTTFPQYHDIDYVRVYQRK
ncbi:MAG: glycoside hydrolase family 16 protein [Prevotellaceae bacterium]|jgi:beta-glucanase (GH16 family)|nr:glycoside hydrolase family 16 protein [Prevotellaceae bacterium]